MDKDNFNANVDFVRGQADMIVLSALADNDKYGLEILNAIQERSQGMYSLKQATLYSSLKRLEKNGYVHSYDGDVSNGAKRVYYGLTSQGREHLNNDKSYWEFCNFLMSNLISDNKFDPINAEKPFDPADFRPLTRRNKSASENEKVVIKYVYLNQDSPADENAIAENNEDVSDAESENPPAVESCEQAPILLGDSSAYEQQVENQETTDIVASQEHVSDETLEIYSDIEESVANRENAQIENFPVGVGENYAENNAVSETSATANQAQDSSEFEEKLAKIVEDLAEIKEKINGNQQVATTTTTAIMSGEENFAEENSITQATTQTQSIENLQEEQVLIDESEHEVKEHYILQEHKDAEEVTASGDNYNEHNIDVVDSQRPSPLYQKRHYFDENNEVNYISSFSDMFNSIEDETVNDMDKEDIEYLTMKEMVYKFRSKGVSIRPYDKKDTMEFYVNRYYYSNKLHFHTSLIIYAVLFIELLFSHLICNRGESKMPAWALVLAIVAVGIYPIARYVLFIIDPTKKTPATFNLKTALLISLLPIITLPIVIALLAFVQFSANVHDYMSMERTVMLPICLLFNIPLYFIVYALLYRTYKYHIN